MIISEFKYYTISKEALATFLMNPEMKAGQGLPGRFEATVTIENTGY